MPLFASKEQRQEERSEKEGEDRARGVVLRLEQANAVPQMVRDYVDRGWVFERAEYAGANVMQPNLPYGMMLVTFRWPASRGAS